MILSGSLVQRKRFGFSFASTRRRLMAACNATREWNTPRSWRRLVNMAKKPSTALIHEAEVAGVMALLRSILRPNARAHSRHPVFWLRCLSAFALHDLVERGKVRAITRFGEKCSSVHGRKLLRHRGGGKLVDAGAIGLRTPNYLGFDRRRQAKRVCAFRFSHVHVGPEVHASLIVRSSPPFCLMETVDLATITSASDFRDDALER